MVARPNAARARVDAALRWCLGPGDGVRLESFRTLLTGCLLLYSLHRWQFAREWLTAAGYHPSAAVTRGQLSVPLLPASWLWGFGLVYFSAIVALLVNVAGARGRVITRAATWVVLGCVFYVSAVDLLAMFTINKLFIACYAILAIAPQPIRELGVDGEPRVTLRSRWPERVLQATLIIQLFGAGVCKLLGQAWIERGDVLWHQAQNVFMTDVAAWMVRALPVQVWAALQHLSLAYELAAPLLLLIPRLRPLAFVLGIGMFAMISLTMHLLVFFALQMVCFYVLFVDEARLHRARSWIVSKMS